MHRRSVRLLAWSLVITLQLSLLATSATGLDVPFPGASVSPPVADSVSESANPDDYYHLLIDPNRQLRAVLTTQDQLDADLAVWPAASIPEDDFTQALAYDTGSGTRSEVIYNRYAEKPGDVSIDVRAMNGSGDYNLVWQLLDAVTLDVSASPSVIPYAGRATIGGVLFDNYESANATGQPLTLWYSYNKKYWTKSSTRSVVDTATGEFSVTVSPKIKTWYRVSAGGLNGVGYAISPIMAVTPKAYLSTPSVPSKVKHRVYFTASGYLKPRHSSGGKSVKLYFERKEHGKWVKRASAWAVNRNYSSYTRFSARVRLTSSGSWRVRAYHSTAQHAPSYSSYRTFTVK